MPRSRSKSEAEFVVNPVNNMPVLATAPLGQLIRNSQARARMTPDESSFPAYADQMFRDHVSALTAKLDANNAQLHDRNQELQRVNARLDSHEQKFEHVHSLLSPEPRAAHELANAARAQFDEEMKTAKHELRKVQDAHDMLNRDVNALREELKSAEARASAGMVKIFSEMVARLTEYEKKLVEEGGQKLGAYISQAVSKELEEAEKQLQRTEQDAEHKLADVAVMAEELTKESVEKANAALEALAEEDKKAEVNLDRAESLVSNALERLSEEGQRIDEKITLDMAQMNEKLSGAYAEMARDEERHAKEDLHLQSSPVPAQAPHAQQVVEGSTILEAQVLLDNARDEARDTEMQIRKEKFEKDDLENEIKQLEATADDDFAKQEELHKMVLQAAYKIEDETRALDSMQAELKGAEKEAIRHPEDPDFIQALEDVQEKVEMLQSKIEQDTEAEKKLEKQLEMVAQVVEQESNDILEKNKELETLQDRLKELGHKKNHEEAIIKESLAAIQERPEISGGSVNEAQKREIENRAMRELLRRGIRPGQDVYKSAMKFVRHSLDFGGQVVHVTDDLLHNLKV